MKRSFEHPLLAGAEIVFCVLVADLHLAVVLEAAAQLDRELAAAGRCTDAIAIAFGACDHEWVLSASADLRRALGFARATIGVLRARAVEGAGSRVTVEWQELALRARTNVVLMQLGNLNAAEHEVSSTRWLYTGKFSNLQDVATCLHHQIGRINAGWLEQRRDLHAQTDRHESDTAEREGARRALYNVALDDAEIAFSMIGRDADLVRFLRSGSSTRSERFRAACREIAAMVGVDFASRGAADGQA